MLKVRFKSQPLLDFIYRLNIWMIYPILSCHTSFIHLSLGLEFWKNFPQLLPGAESSLETLRPGDCLLPVLITQSCPILCDPMDCSPPGFSVHGIRQARILEWVAISFSRGSSQPRDWHRDGTWVTHIAGRFFTIWAIKEALASRAKLTLLD